MDEHLIDLDAEKAVLGSILIDDSVLTKFADLLKPEDFSQERHGIIYKAALHLFNHEGGGPSNPSRYT